MTITQRFNLILLAFIVAFAGLAGIFIHQIGRVYDTTNFANINIVPSMLILNDETRDFGHLRVLIYRHALTEDAAQKEEIERLIRAVNSDLTKVLKAYEPLIADEKDGRLLAASSAALGEYTSHLDQFLRASRSHRDKEAFALINHAVPLAEKLGETLHEHIHYNRELGLNSAAFGAENKSHAVWTLLIIGVALLFSVFAIGFYIARGLVRAMAQSSSVANRIAAGDLSSKITVDGDDETIQMLEAMQTMQNSLAQIVEEIRNIVESAALRGDFSIRMTVIGKTGYVRELSELLNQLSSVSDAGIRNSISVAHAIAEGNLTQEISTAQPGAFGEMAHALVWLQKASLEQEAKRWAKAQLADIIAAVQTAESLPVFGDTALAQLCPAIGAVQGLLYVDNDSINVQKPFAGYGRIPDGPGYAFGEGLVGQCARNRLPMILDDPTGSVLHLSSGLVDAPPSRVVLLPLVQRRAAIGIIELALLAVPDARRQLLLDELPAALAPMLEALRRNLRTEKMAEDMQVQAEELEAQKQALLESGEHLQQSNTLLNEILDAATEIGIIATNLTGTITIFNRGAERMLGWSAEALIGRETPERFHVAEEVEAAAITTRIKLGRHVSGIESVLAMTAATGRDSREWTFVRKDGSRFTGLLLTTTMLSGDGAATGYLGMLQDITESRALETEIERARSMAEEASRMKSDFLANMSHEIRTPMNGIIGMTHLALKTELTTRQRDYLRKIQISGQHLLAIINDILDISKIEAGKLSIERNEFELETTLASVVNLIGEKATEKGLELILDVANDVPVNLLGDSLRLGQVLINYANNALKFTERGEIDIIVRVRERDDDGVLLWFAVRDTGIGLSDEQRSRLFTAFTQGDTSTTRIYGGTGLGLAISKQLAELMEGEVGVDSVPGEGSTFWFTARFGNGTAQKRVQTPDPDLRGRHVLVVDDNDNASQVMSEMLCSMSFAVDVVGCGRDAIEAVKRADKENHPYELVFMDWHMPVLNGIDACRQIQSLALAEPPHLLLVTAYGREEVFHEAEKAGICDVLVKPLNASMLFDTAMRILHGSGHELRGEAGAASFGLDRLGRIAGAHILLVEDNEINQEVALDLLRQAHLTVDLAENGQIALERMLTHNYDLVLMDMQMPVMDGIEATIALRRQPAYTELPIVAMTANVLAQDRQRCIDAGMNDFLAKPIEPELLWQTLLKWIPQRQSTAAQPVTVKTSLSTNAPFDLGIAAIDCAPALRRMLGNTELYTATLRRFCSLQSGMIATMRLALDDDDWASTQRHAHSLKGVSGSIGAQALAQSAEALEQALAEHRARDEIDALITRLDLQLSELISALHTRLPSPVIAPIPDAATCAVAVEELTQLLAESNPEAIAWLERNASVLRGILPAARLTEIEAAIRACDLDDALRLLQNSRF
jgi:two-component system sensor histidine kinase/response regulator